MPGSVIRAGIHRVAVFALAAGMAALASAEEVDDGLNQFRQHVLPILQKYCFDCHGEGMRKGDVSFDEFESDQAMMEDVQLWLRALKNLRADLMPPPKKSQPPPAEKAHLENWIKYSVFQINPRDPDPGHVTLRRLNRTEYQNTIRDLLGVSIDAQFVFPPDDTGHGFDNLADVLTLSPMLLEKYVTLANQVIRQAVPTTPKVMRETTIDGAAFTGAANVRPATRNRQGGLPQPLALSFYEPAAVSNSFKAPFAGTYQLELVLQVNEHFTGHAPDENRCELVFRVDGDELLREEIGAQDGGPRTHAFDLDWSAGNHDLAIELHPIPPEQPRTRSLSLQITAVRIRGPGAMEHWIPARDYRRFFPKPVPADAAGRRAYAGELLGDFARRAFRRPPDASTLNRLVDLAEGVYSQPGRSFEDGVARGMVAILASPRFLFLEEHAEPVRAGELHPRLDEYSLAARLSYFLWSSMPDEALLRLAERRELRNNLASQVDRMLKDRRSEAFVRNFVGQWLRARDIENIAIEAKVVLAREGKPDPDLPRQRRRLDALNNIPERQRTPAERQELAALRNTMASTEMSPELRRAMRLETEKTFEYILRNDRSLLELLSADYTFLNERLAAHYDIPNVTGNEMRLVKLPDNSPRGGILTQGTILGVTSNPTRTSPVKRGMFILENILGTPPPPPPPDIPPLEDAAQALTNRNPSLRDTLAAHRESPLCNSCHNRMDPLGLALENFNALGRWRTTEFGQPIDASGRLITGEPFNDVRDLKRLLVENRRKDFYQTVTEKVLTYALGRALEYYDVETCDQIVAKVEAAEGRPSALLAAVVESAPFQKTRTTENLKPQSPPKPQPKQANARKP